MKLLFSLLLFVYANSVMAQSKRLALSGGFEFQTPLTQPFQSNRTTGVGGSFKAEKYISRRFSVSSSLGYTYYTGKLVYWDDKTDKDFSLIPILAGARYYFRNVYLSFEAGVAVKASSNVNTRPALAPSVGVLVRKKIDIELRLFGIPAGLGYYLPESTFLETGGYSYLGIKTAYRFH